MGNKLTTILKVILPLIFLLLSFWFFMQNKHEFVAAIDLAQTGSWFWLSVGFLLTVLYIILQAWMYLACFRSYNQQISLPTAVKLFLKRNFISVFLPAGGVTSLAFFNHDLEQQGMEKTAIHKASYIYGLVGMLSLLALAFPVLFIWGQKSGMDYTTMIIATLGLSLLLIFITLSISRKGWLYRFLVHRFPKTESFLNGLTNLGISKTDLAKIIAISLLIEVIGILHVYIAMLSIHIPASWAVSITGYTIGTLLLCFSPFLKGIGMVEVSMILVIANFGYSNDQAMSTALMYRVFEFWLPLVFGIFAFLKIQNTIPMRLFPAITVFCIGVINIVSVFTPAISSRFILINEFLPFWGTYLSNTLILIFGVLLIVSSALLMLGYRTAWYFAMILGICSIVGNLTKALDYEESIISLVLVCILWLTRKHYFISSKTVPSLNRWKLSIWMLIVVITYGTIGFLLLGPLHFGAKFTTWESIQNTCNSLLLLTDRISTPQSNIACAFMYSLIALGSCVALYFFSGLFIRISSKEEENDAMHENANAILKKHGKSPLDYFKLYKDKSLFFGKATEGFVAYRSFLNVAVVLETPVCADDPTTILNLLNEFENYCKDKNWRTVYYRVDEKDICIFRDMGKKSLPIGQEAIVNVSSFSLEGKKRKSLRNAINAIEKKGFVSKTYYAPISNNILQQLQQVSDCWLKDTKRRERVFCQGRFDKDEIKNHDIITLEDQEGQILAFLNIIPNYVPNETTYDLIRKNNDAPGGNMDLLILKLMEYCREKGLDYMNMGMAPFSGIENSKPGISLTSVLHRLYEKNSMFKQHRGLKEFKDKFDPEWRSKFLIYDHDYDLLSIPLVMHKVMQDFISPALKVSNKTKQYTS